MAARPGGAAFAEDPTLANIRGYVEDSGEGRWTVQAAIDENVPAPVITLSLLQRFVSRQQDSFSAKVIAALRNQFGGHAVQLESRASQRDAQRAGSIGRTQYDARLRMPMMGACVG